MKIAYFGFNALSSCLDLLLNQDNIEVVAIFSGENNEHTNQIIQLAEQFNIKCHATKPSLKLMHSLLEQGVEYFICAEYPYKIPIPKTLKYSVNIHPTLLPHGRGQTPLPHLILKYPQHAGITLHKMEETFDTGDILIQTAIEIDTQETFDSLNAKIFLQAPMLLQQLLSEWDSLYNKATPQTEGSYWPTISSEQQSINWDMPINQIALICRSFGSLGVKFTLNEKDYYLVSAQCVDIKHHYNAGDVISFDDFKLTIAVLDGLIIIPRPCLFEL